MTVWLDAAKKTELPESEYSVSWKNNVNVGMATATVTLKRNYSGEASVAFEIVPKATKLSKVTAGKRSFTAKWVKQAKQTTGYQLQYATKSNFKKGVKTITVKSAKKISRKVGGLKAGKFYWVHVRTYKKVSGKTYVSNWSPVKRTKTKRG